MKYIIVGGVAGGATVAARLRRLDEDCEIIMFEKGEYISYANCGLPYYIGDTIAERKALFLQTPITFGNRYNVEVRIKTEVISVDPAAKTICAQNLSSGKQYTENYDKLILAPGALPIVPPLKGIDSERIFTLRSVDDTDRIKEQVSQYTQLKKAIVVGAGFIGLEMAENLHQLGYHVSIIEKAPQVMVNVDKPIAAVVQKELKDKGLDLILNCGVTGFTQTENSIKVQLENGKELQGDFVILSIGVKPNTALAASAKIELGQSGGIKVNEYMQTSQEDIYAVGDAVEFTNPISGIPYCCYLAGPANRQARLCADNLVSGHNYPYKGAIATAVAKVFDLTVAATGLSENYLIKNNIPYLTSITHPFSNATYYPGAKQMSIKINFAPKTGRLLGAQVVGAKGVDKRIDLIATIIRNGGTVFDLTDIEHAYAPPYSSAKDPVAYAGYVAENILTEKCFPIHYYELQDILNQKDWKEKYLLIDVRSAMEVKAGFIEGSVNYPLDELREFIEDIPTDKIIIIYCAVGLRGYIASRILLQSGFKKVYNLSGGYKTYALMQSQL